MARRTSAGENTASIRRSRRIACRIRGEIAETSRMGERNNRPQPIRSQIRHEPRENYQRNLDEVSVHTTDTETAEENEEGTQEEGAVNENSQEERERRCIEDRYVQVGENEPRRGRRREGRPERNGEYNRTNDESEQDNDAEKERMILYGREMLRRQNERDRAAHEHARNKKERKRERRSNEERQELEEAIRQSRHENRLRQARLKIPRKYQEEDIFPNGKILREIANLRELVTKGRDGGRRQLEEAIE
ncbi:zinc finger CCCH domain-containing protein 13-like [Papaver somniferum]|uniref:zinc finger CCCH domain-containing protein 13-like n=1 Tax=Papaver somniferum TaxID=3469 RepID=UPI000E6F838F|nr:zinc finger CCCH domain-containing protein 13-like [Papaver somniferum]